MLNALMSNNIVAIYNSKMSFVTIVSHTFGTSNLVSKNLSLIQMLHALTEFKNDIRDAFSISQSRKERLHVHSSLR